MVMDEGRRCEKLYVFQQPSCIEGKGPDFSECETEPRFPAEEKRGVRFPFFAPNNVSILFMRHFCRVFQLFLFLCRGKTPWWMMSWAFPYEICEHVDVFCKLYTRSTPFAAYPPVKY